MQSRLFQQFFEPRCETGVFYKLPWGISEGRRLRVTLDSGEECMDVPHRVHGRVIVPRDGNDDITGAEVIGLSMTQVHIDHVVHCVHINITTGEYLFGTECS